MKRERVCDWCGCRYEGYPGKPKGKRTFCSQACRNAWMGWFNIHEKRANRPGGLTATERKKIADSRRASASGDGYRKAHGRLEHRAVAEQLLGRPLKSSEVVHHIDGDKRNNAPENLVVLPSQSEHMKLHLNAKGGKL